MTGPPTAAQKRKEIEQLLARTPVITGPCALDLLVFLHRHPRTLLTNDQLAAFVGYDMKQIAKCIDAFVDVGLVERTQNATHAARMYLLVLEGPQNRGIEALLALGSTLQGRRDILDVLVPGRSDPPAGHSQARRRRLHAVA